MLFVSNLSENSPSPLDFWAGEKPNKVWFLPCFFTENLAKFSTSDDYGITSNFPNAASVVEDESVRYLIKGANFVAGDIVLWNGVQKVVVAQENYSTTTFPEDKFTPIGVVVIPESHMYDGRARMMSTRWMSCDDPENGSIRRHHMVWGTTTDLADLTNFMQVPVIARYDDENQGGVTALTEPQAIYTADTYAYLSSDNPSWTGETNPEDLGTKWCQSASYWADSGHTVFSAYNYYAPSPYAKDGRPNPLYRATSYSGGGINNALSYFDGRQQTDVILEARGEKDYGSWKPSTGTPEDYPAVSCCDMYHTVGTNQGDWYLPSCAELGYVVARLNRINTAMTKVNGMQELPSYWAWSSSEHDASHAMGVAFDNGRVNYWPFKDSYLSPVVAFLTV